MFKTRSSQKELLDGSDIPEKDLYRNLKELHSINTLLGGYNVSLSALKSLLQKNKIYHFVDIGSGGGDTLKIIAHWAERHKFQLKLYGIDIKPQCQAYALSNTPTQDIDFFCDDYRNILTHIPKVDILHASLFCHHLSKAEITDLVKFAIQNKMVLVINDLERNPLAYYAIKFLTRLFSRSYLVKNDAPLSVLRGFKKTEWIDILNEAGAKQYRVKNKWAFRHQVIVYE